jgi:hypothetical protein
MLAAGLVDWRFIPILHVIRTTTNLLAAGLVDWKLLWGRRGSLVFLRFR